jgi:uncharacterized protein
MPTPLLRERMPAVTMRPPRMPNHMKTLRLFIAAALAAAALHCQGQPLAPMALQDKGPALVANSSTFDFTSTVNGRPYRVFVSVPPGFNASVRYPVLYVLDGNQYFGTASEAMARQSFLRTIKPAIVVGIGYQSTDFERANRERWFDLTHHASEVAIKYKTGGGKQFQQVLLDEVRPFIAARFPVDSGAEAIWGQSLGGLFILRLFLDQPHAFAAYVLSSPSVWWNNKEALAGLDGLPMKLSRSPARVRLLVTSAGDEQPRARTPDFIYEPGNAMVDDAAELAIRLARSAPADLAVSRVIFDGEVHNSVSPASLSRTLRFLFPPEPAATR